VDPIRSLDRLSCALIGHQAGGSVHKKKSETFVNAHTLTSHSVSIGSEHALLSVEARVWAAISGFRRSVPIVTAFVPNERGFRSAPRMQPMFRAPWPHVLKTVPRRWLVDRFGRERGLAASIERVRSAIDGRSEVPERVAQRVRERSAGPCCRVARQRKSRDGCATPASSAVMSFSRWTTMWITPSCRCNCPLTIRACAWRATR